MMGTEGVGAESMGWAGQTPAARAVGGALVDGVYLDEAELDAKEVELAELSAHLDAATHRQLTLIRVMDVSERWAKRGAKSCAHWLSWRVGLDPGAARERVRTARKLGDLPATDDALRRGVLSYSKARAISHVATPANEACLLGIAEHTTAAQLEKVCCASSSARTLAPPPTTRPSATSACVIAGTAPCGSRPCSSRTRPSASWRPSAP